MWVEDLPLSNAVRQLALDGLDFSRVMAVLLRYAQQHGFYFYSFRDEYRFVNADSMRKLATVHTPTEAAQFVLDECERRMKEQANALRNP